MAFCVRLDRGRKVVNPDPHPSPKQGKLVSYEELQLLLEILAQQEKHGDCHDIIAGPLGKHHTVRVQSTTRFKCPKHSLRDTLHSTSGLRTCLAGEKCYTSLVERKQAQARYLCRGGKWGEAKAVYKTLLEVDEGQVIFRPWTLFALATAKPSTPPAPPPTPTPVPPQLRSAARRSGRISKVSWIASSANMDMPRLPFRREGIAWAGATPQRPLVKAMGAGKRS